MSDPVQPAGTSVSSGQDAARDVPVFIVGVGRSGTTLLMQMFDHHPRFAIPWESHFIPVLHRHLASFGDLTRAENRLAVIEAIARFMKISYRDVGQGDWIPGLEENAARLAAESGPSYPEILNAVYGFYAAGRGRARWGDKTPNYIGCVDLLGRLFPQAQFVHLIRDGRDVAASVMPLSFGPKTAYVAATAWKRQVTKGLEFARANPGRMFTLHYEDLTADPEKCLRDICMFLGESFHDEMLRYHEDGLKRVARTAHHGRIGESVNQARSGRWKKDLTADQIRIYEAIAGDLLAGLGYEVSNPQARLKPLDAPLGTAGHWARLFRWNTKPLSLPERIRLFAGRLAFTTRRRVKRLGGL